GTAAGFRSALVKAISLRSVFPGKSRNSTNATAAAARTPDARRIGWGRSANWASILSMRLSGERLPGELASLILRSTEAEKPFQNSADLVSLAADTWLEVRRTID